MILKAEVLSPNFLNECNRDITTGIDGAEDYLATHTTKVSSSFS